MKNYRYIFIPGSHTELSLAELLQTPFLPSERRCVYASPEGIVMDFKQPLKDAQAVQDQLGGNIKIAHYMRHFEKDQIQEILLEHLVKLYEKEQRKIYFGLSFYIKDRVSTKEIFGTLKKSLKSHKVSARFVNHKTDQLNAATLWKEKLLEDRGSELIVIETDRGWEMGKTIACQNIDLYSLRDFQKPYRDMLQGILPPKLSQIMLNLAGVQWPQKPKKNEPVRSRHGVIPMPAIYDPFCGSGVILMEALLQGYNVIGSDINEQAIDHSEKNIMWLKENYHFDGNAKLYAHDATRYFRGDVLAAKAIVTESYLGPAVRGSLDEERVKKLVAEVDPVYTGFFKNLIKMRKLDVPIIICFPFFRLGKNKNIFLEKTLEKAKALGYTNQCLIPRSLQQRSGLEMTSRNSLLYFRSDQKVGREIFLFQKRKFKRKKR